MNFSFSWLACSNQDPNRTQTWQNWWASQVSFNLQVPLSFLCSIFFFLKCFVEGSRLFIPKVFQFGILLIVVHGYHSCKLVARSRDYWMFNFCFKKYFDFRTQCSLLFLFLGLWRSFLLHLNLQSSSLPMTFWSSYLLLNLSYCF